MTPDQRLAWGREVVGGAVTAALVVGFCGAMVAASPGFFWHDDAQSWSVPLMYDVGRALASGEWPLLTPHSRHMTSLAGEYQPGIFSPLVVLGYVLAVALGGTLPGTAAVYATFCLVVAATGAHALARLEGVPRPLATMVGLVAALNGWCIGWAATNWFPLAAGLGPLLWAWAALVHALRGGPRLAPVVAAGVALALLIAAGGPHMVLMGAVITALLVGRASLQGPGRAAVVVAGAAWAVGVGLSAPAWASFLAYLPHTVRVDVPLALNWDRLMPAGALPALVSPAWIVRGFGSAPWQPHVPIELVNGLVVTAVWLSALALLDRRPWPAVRWHVGLSVLFLGVAMLPGFGMFRWSFRWLLPAHVAMALAAAQWLAWRWSLGKPRLRDHPALWGAGALGLVHLATGRGGVVPPAYHAVLAGLLMAWAPLEQAARRGRRWARWAPAGITLAVLAVTYRQLPIDLAVPTWPMPARLEPHPAFEVGRCYMLVGEVRDLYPPHPSAGPSARGFRGPDFASVRLVGALPVLAGIDFVNGYSPLGPAGTARAFYLELAGFLPSEGVAFVLSEACGPGALLARIGVDGLVVTQPGPTVSLRLQAQGWRRVAAAAGGELWHRLGPPAPLVESAPGVRRLAAEDDAGFATALAAHDGLAAAVTPGGGVSRFAPRDTRVRAARRNAIEVEVAPGPGPALLRLKRGWGPHWEARLEGRPLEVLALDGMVPGVVVPAGAGGRLVLTFRPAGLGVGLGLSGVTLAGLFVLGRWRRRPGHDAGASGMG